MTTEPHKTGIFHTFRKNKKEEKLKKISAGNPKKVRIFPEKVAMSWNFMRGLSSGRY